MERRGLWQKSDKVMQDLRVSCVCGVHMGVGEYISSWLVYFPYRYDRTSLHLLNKVSRLVFLLKKHCHLSNDVWEEGGIPLLIKVSTVGSREVQRKARLALALVGHAPPYEKQGLRILTIDGGGTR